MWSLRLQVFIHGFPDCAEHMLPLASDVLCRTAAAARPSPRSSPLVMRAALVPRLLGYELGTALHGTRAAAWPWQGYHMTQVAEFIAEWIVRAAKTLVENNTPLFSHAVSSASSRSRRRLPRSVHIDLVGHDWGSFVAQVFYAMHRKDMLTAFTVRDEQHDGQTSFAVASLTLMAVPPAPGFFPSLVRCPVQLLHSHYMFLFQLPWLPEYLLAPNVRFVSWLWRRWSPNMLPASANRMATAVTENVFRCRSSLTASSSSSSASLVAETPEDDDGDAKEKNTDSQPATSAREMVSGFPVARAAINYYRCFFAIWDPEFRRVARLVLGSSASWLAHAPRVLVVNGDADGCMDRRVFQFCCDEVRVAKRSIGRSDFQHVEVPLAGHWVHCEAQMLVAGAIEQNIMDES
mgnify:CR=1 FL=1